MMTDTSNEIPEKKCFVICPIGETGSPERAWSDDVLENLIQPIAKEFGYLARRAIDNSRPGEITTNLVADIIEADLVVADLTFHNANVFYELAVRHSLGAPYIHIAKFGTKIPFDVNVINTVMISADSYLSVDSSRAQLRTHFQAVVDGTASFENPLKRYQQKLQADQTNDPIEKRLVALEEQMSANMNAQPAAYREGLRLSSVPVRSSYRRFGSFNTEVFNASLANLHSLLIQRKWKLIYNPKTGDNKIITFNLDGSIGEGRNDNEFGWRLNGGRLEILQADGLLHSSFVFVPTAVSFQHTNDPAARSIVNQTIVPVPSGG